MKSFLYALFFLSIFTYPIQSQVIWNEDFDNYTTGNVDTINIANFTTPFSSYMMSQGDWMFWEIPHSYSSAPQYTITIETEPGRGKIMKIQDIPVANTLPTVQGTSLFAQKMIPNIDVLWNNRTAGNDILKYEIEFHFGVEGSVSGPVYMEILSISRQNSIIPNNIPAIAISLNKDSELVGTISPFPYTEFWEFLTPWMWQKVIAYVDYTTGYVYFEVPYLNLAVKSQDYLSGQYLKLFNHFEIIFRTDVAVNGGFRQPNVVKLDNIKVEAVNTLPLSLEKLASTTFKVFPNPATDVLTVTNSEDVGIVQIELFDSNGKKVKTQEFANESQVQLDLSSVASGIYQMYIKTIAGIAVEKVVKK